MALATALAVAPTVPVPANSPAAAVELFPTTVPTAVPIVRTIPVLNPVPDGARAMDPTSKAEAATVWDLPAGSMVFNPVSGRHEVIDPSVAQQAVLFGDSQSSGIRGMKGIDTWVEAGLAARGYKVRFLGAPGTGYVASSPSGMNYLDAVSSGRVVLPYGKPALVVVQGGGNDAAQGVSDAQILANADGLLRELKASYPNSKFLFIGILSRGGASGGRRSQVDTLLAGFAKGNGVNFLSPSDWLTRYGTATTMIDGVHLTASGHKGLSKVLADQLAAMHFDGPAH
ncbi:SGNH/GDSL hydrolase family protein [Arthrobacter sp. E3]|uniref:GDSL-type esterase/lipase family protein n=1 Tax=Arthrobacter sp. E3 TaxID=517402 RepID=UPI001A946024